MSIIIFTIIGILIFYGIFVELYLDYLTNLIKSNSDRNFIHFTLVLFAFYFMCSLTIFIKLIKLF